MKKIFDFTNHLNALMDDDESLEELNEIYPRQRDYILKTYNDQTCVDYYLCLVHLCKEFNTDSFKMGDDTYTLNPELLESKQ